MERSEQPLRLCWHFDFHSHRSVRIGHDPDPDGAADALARASVSEIITFAKGHCGFTYYPTDLSTCYRHPKMSGDPFGAIVHACKSRGIRVLAYISFGIDGEGARHHPHWRQVGPNGLQPPGDGFINVCPFTSYTDESVLPQVEEICGRYPIDGFFFDTMGALGVCHCDACQRDYEACGFGRIPRDPRDPTLADYGRFRHDRGLALLDRISTFIQQRLPGAVIGFNQVGSIPFPEPLPDGCTRLTLDYQTYGPQSRMASLCAAFGSTSRKPADVMPTIFNGGWGDWSPAPPQRHEQIAVAIWARRCTPYMGDRLHPANRLAAPSAEAMTRLADVRARLQREFPPTDSKLTPDVVIVHAVGCQYGRRMEHFAIDPRVRQQALEGMAGLLLDAGANYTIHAEHTLGDLSPGVGLVVLPETESILPETEAALRQFVESGGQLLLVGRLPRVGDRLIDWAGVDQDREPWQDHVYLPWIGKKEAHPLLCRGDTFATRPRAGTELLAPAIAPLDMTYGVRFGWGIAPPDDLPSEQAALTACPLGDGGGRVWFLAGPLASDYQRMGDWRQVQYVAALLRQILPNPRARLHSPFGQVELILHTTQQTSWAVLVNHGGESMHGINNPLQWPRTWGPVPPYRVKLLLRSLTGHTPRRVIAKGRAVRSTFSSFRNELSIPLAMNAIWRIVRVDW